MSWLWATSRPYQVGQRRQTSKYNRSRLDRTKVIAFMDQLGVQISCLGPAERGSVSQAVDTCRLQCASALISHLISQSHLLPVRLTTPRPPPRRSRPRRSATFAAPPPHPLSISTTDSPCPQCSVRESSLLPHTLSDIQMHTVVHARSHVELMRR